MTKQKQKKKPRFPISKGQRKIDDESRPSVPRHKLVVPELL